MVTQIRGEKIQQRRLLLVRVLFDLQPKDRQPPEEKERLSPVYPSTIEEDRTDTSAQWKHNPEEDHSGRRADPKREKEIHVGMVFFLPSGALWFCR